MRPTDVVVIGAGASGMICAIEAGRRGRSVTLVDHSPTLGRKIAISGGGRCNFTNLHTSPIRFVSSNPDFCKSALSRFTPEDFVRLVEKHRIPYHEKKDGQLFCDGPAQGIVKMLAGECADAGVETILETRIGSVRKETLFHVETSKGERTSSSLVIATGGLSIPKIGATDFGHRIARQFGLNVTPTAPALDGFVFSEADRKAFQSLSGLSLEAVVRCGKSSTREQLLFTHAGLSGPAALTASLYWNRGERLAVDFLPDPPDGDLAAWFLKRKAEGSRSEAHNLLARFLPRRFAETFCALALEKQGPLMELSDGAIERFCENLHAWTFTPTSTVGYGRAEVTKGGVDTRELSSKTMEARNVPGLYFVGEVVDVTGELGGFNFQWAWASGWAAGQAV